MIEFSLMLRESEHSKVKQIKYLKLLIQEMAVKVDIGFITSLAAVFQSGPENEDVVSQIELESSALVASSSPA